MNTTTRTHNTHTSDDKKGQQDLVTLLGTPWNLLVNLIHPFHPTSHQHSLTQKNKHLIFPGCCGLGKGSMTSLTHISHSTEQMPQEINGHTPQPGPSVDVIITNLTTSFIQLSHLRAPVTPYKRHFWHSMVKTAKHSQEILSTKTHTTKPCKQVTSTRNSSSFCEFLHKSRLFHTWHISHSTIMEKKTAELSHRKCTQHNPQPSLESRQPALKTPPPPITFLHEPN